MVALSVFVSKLPQTPSWTCMKVPPPPPLSCLRQWKRVECSPFRPYLKASITTSFLYSLMFELYKSLPLSKYQMMEKMQTSQELRMLSSVTLNCQVTKIVMNSGSQLSDISVSSVTSPRIVFVADVVFLL